MGGKQGFSDRRETDTERLDRNWNDMLQELRVMQTGTQLIAGFLLTLPFTNRFTTLDTFERTLFLGLVVLAGVTLAVMLAPISIHRRLFGEHAKERLVGAAHWLMVAALTLVGALITGIVFFIFQVVLGSGAAMVGGGAVLALVLGLLAALPVAILPPGNQRDAEDSRRGRPRP
jgi:uncharacterized protein DUF6328